jgi:tricarballylate dehydrogenase
MWETEAVKLLTDEQYRICGVKVRKSDELFNDVLANNVMLACGGFDDNPEMLAKYIGNQTVDLPLIAPGI